MLWQSRHNTDPQHMSINTQGQIEMKSKQDFKKGFERDAIIRLKPEA